MPIIPRSRLIRLAINRKRIITFTYAGLRRTCEPHVYGTTNGRRQLLCWQLDGGSKRGGIPEWRRFDISDILNLRVTRDAFPGARPVPYPHSKWDEIILTV